MRNPQLSRERVRALAVDRREVDRLGSPTHLARDVTDVDAENDRGGLAVDVATRLERGDECRIAGKVRQQAKLDLRIVGDEELPSRLGHESAADVATEFAAYRNVLEVRVTRRQASRRRHGLVE